VPRFPAATGRHIIPRIYKKHEHKHRGMLLSRMQSVTAWAKPFLCISLWRHCYPHEFIQTLWLLVRNMVNLLSLSANHTIWINASNLRHRSLKKRSSTDCRAPSTTCRCRCNVNAVCTMCESIHSLFTPSS
jgi:hypothetical protein